MALVVQDAQLVWGKVNSALNGVNISGSPNPAIVAAFKALKSYLSQQGGVKELQYLTYSEAQADAAGGTVLLAGACKVYAAFYRKNTASTVNWTWLYNDATNDGTAADAMIVFPGTVASQEQCHIIPAGLAFDTGVVVTQYVTDPLGASDGSDGGDGFVIVGRP